MSRGARSQAVMRYAFILFAFMCAVPPVAAAEFATVMRQAQQSEAALEPQQMVGLVKAQGSAMQQALTRCTPRRSTIPDRFAVVIRIDEQGRGVDAWTKNSTEFENCFAAEMREIIHYIPPTVPFYTSIDYRRNRGHDRSPD